MMSIVDVLWFEFLLGNLGLRFCWNCDFIRIAILLELWFYWDFDFIGIVILLELRIY